MADLFPGTFYLSSIDAMFRRSYKRHGPAVTSSGDTSVVTSLGMPRENGYVTMMSASQEDLVRIQSHTEVVYNEEKAELQNYRTRS